MKKSAFTLIELLVVISIIAILAGIALPVFGKVMEKSRATNCASNLKQLGLGIAAYLNDNDETIFKDPQEAGTDPWPKVLKEKYVTNWKVFKCPFDKRADATGDSTPISYGINKNVMAWTPGAKSGKWNGSFSRLVAPSQLILMAPEVTDDKAANPKFSDANIASTNVGLKPRSGETNKLGTHNGRGQINALFADSHVASLKYLPHGDSEAFSSDKAETTGTLSGVIVKWQPVAP